MILRPKLLNVWFGNSLLESRNGVFMWDSVILCAMKRKSLEPTTDTIFDELYKNRGWLVL